MKIAIDYDHTYTKDPIMWDKIIKLMQEMNHEVWCISARPEDHMPKVKFHLGPLIGHDRCIGTNLKGKRRYVWEHYGLSIDVWIDDTPEAVGADIYTSLGKK